MPTWVEIGIFLGTLGLFFTLYLLFTRVAPVVAVAEVKAILKSAGDQYLTPNKEHHVEVMKEYQEAEAEGKPYASDHAHAESH